MMALHAFPLFFSLQQRPNCGAGSLSLLYSGIAFYFELQAEKPVMLIAEQRVKEYRQANQGVWVVVGLFEEILSNCHRTCLRYIIKMRVLS